MSLRRGILLVVPCLAAAAGRIEAQGSVFGIQGLGTPGRPLAVRNAALGGGFSAVDPFGMLNPAALARWRGVAGWGVGAPGYRTLHGPDSEESFRSTRFPLFGFASQLRPKLSVGIAIGDYLDRNWNVVVRDTTVLRGDTVEYQDQSQSLGGVSDLRFAASYQVSPRVSLGAAVHALAGSTRLAVQRDFNSSVYDDYVDVSTSDFRGVGASVGVYAAAGERLNLGASVRWSGTLTARNTRSGEARVALPAQLALGASYGVTEGVNLGGTLEFAGWSRSAADLEAAGQSATRDVWSLGLGVELERVSLLILRTPVRLGYRWRQLPTPIAGEFPNERAVTGGIGAVFASGRTTADFGLEIGNRHAGALKESFHTYFVGVTVRP